MPVESPARDRWLDLVLFAGAAFLLVAAASLQVARDEDGREQVAASGRSLPPLCLFRAVTGLPCPGCGITRSVVDLAHGEISASFRHHPFGIFVLFLIAAQIPYRAVVLLHPGARAFRFPTLWTGRIFWGTCGLFLACWVVRLFA